MSRHRWPVALLLVFVPLLGHPARGAERVTLALNWKAQPELGGFYQALAAGHYRRAGLDVTIRPGGPMINNRPLLPVGHIDFLIGTNLLPAFDVVKQEIPTRVVAAFFQKDPQCLIAHPAGTVSGWDDLKQTPLLMGAPGRHSFFLWLESAHGFQRKMLRPYNHSLAPYLLHKDWAVQGYATAEPKRITDAGGADPQVFLLAEHGWSSYSTVLETRQDLIDNDPQKVQAFVDASILGWLEYLYGDRSAADALILRDNRAMTPEQIAFSVEKMRTWGLIDSGEAVTRGLGAINGERITEFYATMTKAGLLSAGEINPAEAYTTRFVNQGVGLRRRAELLGEANESAPPGRP